MGWWFWLPNHQVDLACIGALLIALMLFESVFQRCVLAPIGEWLAERNLERLVKLHRQFIMDICPICAHRMRTPFNGFAGSLYRKALCATEPCKCRWRHIHWNHVPWENR